MWRWYVLILQGLPIAPVSPILALFIPPRVNTQHRIQEPPLLTNEAQVQKKSKMPVIWGFDLSHMSWRAFGHKKMFDRRWYLRRERFSKHFCSWSFFPAPDPYFLKVIYQVCLPGAARRVSIKSRLPACHAHMSRRRSESWNFIHTAYPHLIFPQVYRDLLALKIREPARQYRGSQRSGCGP